MRIESTDAIDKLREMAGGCELRVVNVDPGRGNITLKTTIPGRLLGPKGSIAKGFQRESGWRLNISALFAPGEAAIEKAVALDGCRRAEVTVEGPKEYRLRAVFDVGMAPDKEVWSSFYEATGWRIEVIEESEPLPVQKAVDVISAHHPTAAIVGFQEFADDELALFAVNPDRIPAEGDPAYARMCRAVGWKTISTRPANEMPESADRGNLDPYDLMDFELGIIKSRCGACVGAGTVARPRIDLRGVAWERQTCPSCDGAGDASGRSPSE